MLRENFVIKIQREFNVKKFISMNKSLINKQKITNDALDSNSIHSLPHLIIQVFKR